MYLSTDSHLHVSVNSHSPACICQQTLTCMYLSTDTHLHVSVNRHTPACICQQTLTCMYLSTDTHLYVYVNRHSLVCICQQTHTCMYLSTDTHLHVSINRLTLACICQQVEKLRHAYPPFVNYFEKTKEKITQCTKSDHRFYAFMKVCQRRPECGRQSLPDLLMNIVQRLPRIELLLQRKSSY